jgi:plasmid stabilization system protein ParE
MEIKIEWLTKAKRQVKGIYEYYRSEAGVDVAQKIVQKIYAKPNILATNPYFGQPDEYLLDLPQGYRRLLEGRYKIVYYVEENVVWIVAVFDTRQNPAKLRKLVKD